MTSAELKRMRKRLGLTQAALAKQLGVKTNTVARWEQGARGIAEPMARFIQLLVKAQKEDSK